MTRPATPLEVLERKRPAHELRADLADLWRDGFHAGAAAERARLEPAVANANHDADYWYLRATYTPAEIDDMHQRAIDAAFESGAATWLDHAEPQASWADARQELAS